MVGNPIPNVVRKSIHSAVRPVARLVRKWIEPVPPTVRFAWHSVACRTSPPLESFELLLPSPTAIADRIQSGRYEPETLQLIQHLVVPGKACFDIGAHYGYFTACLCRVAADSPVHAFEPFPDHCARLRLAAKQNRFPNLQVHETAVASVSGRLKLRVPAGPDDDDSMSYLQDFGGVPGEEAAEKYSKFSCIEVQAVTLDELVPHQPKFIKIDAEGAESGILTAGQTLLEECRPRVIVEVHGIEPAVACAAMMHDLGYDSFAYGRPLTAAPLLFLHQSDAVALSQLRRVDFRLRQLVRGKESKPLSIAGRGGFVQALPTEASESLEAGR
ncbi:MAG: FkbM family methyltransferase [Planctomycetaceae bacterium]